MQLYTITTFVKFNSYIIDHEQHDQAFLNLDDAVDCANTLNINFALNSNIPIDEMVCFDTVECERSTNAKNETISYYDQTDYTNPRNNQIEKFGIEINVVQL